MKIITVLLCLFSLALVPFVSAAQPNIVFIMADDFGLGDVGRQYEERTGQAALAPTPTLDALANEGLWFSDAHSPTALCSPSRYAVMTGNYNYRSYAPWGVWGTFRPTAIAVRRTSSMANFFAVSREVASCSGVRPSAVGWSAGTSAFRSVLTASVEPDRTAR